MIGRGRQAARLALLCALPVVSACGALKPTPTAPLATSLRELTPHGDRDHFVFVIERRTEAGFQPEGIQVEHVTKLEAPGEFEVTLSEDGMGTGRIRIRDDGKTIWLISEDDYSRAMRLTYDPPLPYLQVPLLAGEQRAAATVKMTELGNGQAAGTMQVVQVMVASAVPAGTWRSGTYGSGVQLQTTRSLKGPDGTLDLTTTMVVVPGIGEVRSEGGLTGAPSLRRELACAIISGRSIGDCSTLMRRQR